MGLISKEEFIYSDYSWNAYANNDPKVAGEPDKTNFDRKEGYEVLYLINKFAKKHDLREKSSGQKAEEMLHDYLPVDVRDQQKVMDWLANNWNEYEF